MSQFNPCFIFTEHDDELIPTIDGNHNHLEMECRLFAKSNGYDVIQAWNLCDIDNYIDLRNLCSTIRKYIYTSKYAVSLIIQSEDRLNHYRHAESEFEYLIREFENIICLS